MSVEQLRRVLQLSDDEAAAAIDELGLYLGLDCLDSDRTGALTKERLLKGLGTHADVAELFCVSDCDTCELREQLHDTEDHAPLCRAEWIPIIKSLRHSRRQRANEAAKVAELEAQQKQAQLHQQRAPAEQAKLQTMRGLNSEVRTEQEQQCSSAPCDPNEPTAEECAVEHALLRVFDRCAEQQARALEADQLDERHRKEIERLQVPQTERPPALGILRF